MNGEWLNRIAKGLSVVLYPLFVPTYGIGLFCLAFHCQVMPLTTPWVTVAIIGTFFFTCLIPVTAIWLMIRRGSVRSMQIEHAEERTTPYLYSAVAFAFWSYMVISVLRAPDYLCFIAVGATVAICLVAIINMYWKISAHLTGMGGLTGGIMAFCLGIEALPTWGTLTTILGLSLLLMYARLYLNAHTPAQVCVGWLLGITCTFVPFCIYQYAV